jgi:hypothetical protein
MDALPLTLGIDHDKKRLVIVVNDPDGHESKGSLGLEDLAKFMAILSHYQHALVHSCAGQKIPLPLDPNVAFEENEKYALGAHEGLSRASVGIDDAMGAVAMTALGSSGRLTGYRMSPDMARWMAQALVKAAEQTPNPPTQAFQA